MITNYLIARRNIARLSLETIHHNSAWSVFDNTSGRYVARSFLMPTGFGIQEWNRPAHYWN